MTAGACLQGVVEFSLCLLFAKLVSYTFLFWLPLYITKAGETLTGTPPSSQQTGGGPGPSLIRLFTTLTTANLDAKKAGDLSTLFDVGGIVGECVCVCVIFPDQLLSHFDSKRRY